MFETVPAWLASLVNKVTSEDIEGTVSHYLPELALAKDTHFGIAIDMGEQEKFSVGSEHQFTVQSVIKLISLLLAIHANGRKYTMSRVGEQPSRFPYNSPHNFDAFQSKTSNPFCNAGAFVTLDLVGPKTSQPLVFKVLDCLRELTQNERLKVNMAVAHSEYKRSSTNRFIMRHLYQHGVLRTNLDQLLWAYCQICSIEMNVEDLARLGNVLSTHSRLENRSLTIESADLQAVRRAMRIAGMYEDSAIYASSVGIPTKSGISGSVLGILAGTGGIGIYAPSLNRTGNSVRGIKMMHLLSQHYNVPSRT